MGCASSSEVAQTHHVLHHFPCTSVLKARPTSPDTLQRVVGRVAAVDPCLILNAPSSGRRCLFWELEVWEEFWPADKVVMNSRTEWRLVLSAAQQTDFKIRDGNDFAIVPQTPGIKFRVAGNSFRQARVVSEVPFIIQDMKDDEDYTWGQTYTYAGGVQTGLLQTGHYKVIEHTIAENDILTVLCYLKHSVSLGQNVCSTFPKQSVYFLGTKGWTKQDRTWWDTLFNSKKHGEVKNRMVISNRPFDTDGVSVEKSKEIRCAYCTLVSHDGKLVRLKNNSHDRQCQLFRRPSQTAVVPSSARYSEELKSKAMHRRSSKTVSCMRGHPLKFETRRGTSCTWCTKAGTTYHCNHEECKIQMCADCYDLTRDSGASIINQDEESKIDSDTLESMVALAPMLAGQGRLQEAEYFYRRCQKGYQELEGDESLDLLLAADGLANVLKLQKKTEEAEETLRFVLHGMENMLGVKSRNTLNVMEKLANLLYEDGKLNEAEKLYRTVIELEAEVLGHSHPGTLKAIESLAEVYEKEGKIEEAIPVERRLLQVREHNMGVTHPKTEESRTKLISLLQMKGRDGEVTEVLQRKQKMLTERSPSLVAASPADAASIESKNSDDLFALA